MFKSKKFNYLILSFIIFSLPIVEFLKDNFDEIDIVLGKSFFLLIFFIFLFLLTITFLLKFFLKKKDFYDSLLISVVGFWLLFKHSSVNQFLITIIINNPYVEVLTAEISLIIISVFFLIFLIIFLQNNILFKNFLFIFFLFKFFFYTSSAKFY